MFLIINDKLFGECRSLKEVNQTLDAYTTYIKNNFGKDVLLKPLKQEDLKKGYVEIVTQDNVSTIQIVEDCEKLQKYLLTKAACEDSNKNRMLDALNAIGKRPTLDDKNIYLLCNNKIVGKSESLEDINRYITSYLKSNTPTETSTMMKNFMCNLKNEINKDNQGFYNLMYFKQNDGKTSNFSLIYPVEQYQKYIYYMQQPSSIYYKKDFSKEKMILAQWRSGKIRNINEISITKTEPNLIQEKAMSDVELFEKMRNKYSKFNRVRELLQQVSTKAINLKEENKQIQDFINSTLAKKNNVKWILNKYNEDNSLPLIEKPIKEFSRKDLCFMDNETFKKYSLLLISEQLQDYSQAEKYRQYTETYDNLKKNEVKLEELRDSLWTEIKKMEEQYKEFNPNFNLIKLEQEMIKKGGASRDRTL